MVSVRLLRDVRPRSRRISLPGGSAGLQSRESPRVFIGALAPAVVCSCSAVILPAVSVGARYIVPGAVPWHYFNDSPRCHPEPSRVVCGWRRGICFCSGRARLPAGRDAQSKNPSSGGSAGLQSRESPRFFLGALAPVVSASCPAPFLGTKPPHWQRRCGPFKLFRVPHPRFVKVG